MSSSAGPRFSLTSWFVALVADGHSVRIPESAGHAIASGQGPRLEPAWTRADGRFVYGQALVVLEDGKPVAIARARMDSFFLSAEAKARADAKGGLPVGTTADWDTFAGAIVARAGTPRVALNGFSRVLGHLSLEVTPQALARQLDMHIEGAMVYYAEEAFSGNGPVWDLRRGGHLEAGLPIEQALTGPLALPPDGALGFQHITTEQHAA